MKVLALIKITFYIIGRKMKVVILAGGFGSRLSEYTETIPKPMVQIGNKPMLFHIMNYYASFGLKDFIIALGYKAQIIKEYFLNYKELNSNFTINMSNGNINIHEKTGVDWNVTLVETGQNTMTGGRLLRLKDYLGNNDFMLTYGDGLSNVNINKLLKFHQQNKKMVTVTAVRPVARFGELKIKNDDVISFQEKPQIGDGWINGGFFVMKPEILNFINNDEDNLEKDILEKIVSINEICAFKHSDFWHCMDTKRDRDRLEEIFYSNNVPWVRSEKR